MGARPSSFKAAGGGRMNGVDGRIEGYRWTDEFNGEPFIPGKKTAAQGGGEKFHSLFFELTSRVDGAEEDTTDTLFAGGYDNFEVSEDGLTIVPVEDGYELGKGTPFDKFITSLVAPGGNFKEGFPEDRLSETDINYEPIIGTRVRFGQEAELDKNGKPKMRKGKGKFLGREFPQTSTVVTQVYELPGGKVGGKKGVTAKPTVKGKSAVEPEESVEDLAASTLIAIVSANKGKMLKAKLPMAVLNYMMKHPQREAVRKLVGSDDFLETENGWTYNAKKTLVTVEVAEDEDSE